jgi:hypothetical protein
MSKLLNEVIADAKAVKETAIQTAIATLRESFEPTVRRMISQKLTEQDPEEEEFEYPEEEESMDMPEEEPMDEPAPVAAPAPAPEAPVEPAPAPAPAPEEDDEDIEATVEAMLRELEDEEFADEMSIEEDDDELDGYDDELDGLLAELEGEEEIPMDEPEEEEYTSESLRRKLSKVNKQLKEAYRVIVTQKRTINEVHLLNLKLMNVTKINNKFDLGDSDKLKVLEAFDRADNTKEVTLVYKTLVDNFTMAKNRIHANRRVNESVSRPVKSIGNQFEFSKRFMELANIKKK